MFVSGGYVCEEDFGVEDCWEVRTVKYSEDGKTFGHLAEMPQPNTFHCMAVLENGSIFVTGGFTDSCFLYDIDENKWQRCPDMMRNRKSACCAVLKRDDGSEEIIVAGGEHGEICSNVDIFSMVTRKWRPGKTC